METETRVAEEQGFDRRAFIRRSAVVGTAVWVAPTVNSMLSPAFATGTVAGGCTACLTGGGQQRNGEAGASVQDGSGGTYFGVTLGLGQLCCTPPNNGNAEPQIQVTIHPTNALGVDTTVYHFDTLVSITCSKEEPNPAPGPNTATCANVFTGTATDENGNTLHFQLEDHGEPGVSDWMSLTITDGDGNTVLVTSGVLSTGNLMVHDGLAGLARDCTGC